MKRNLFEELKAGIEDINSYRAGKITLRNYTLKKRKLIPISATYNS